MLELELRMMKNTDAGLGNDTIFDYQTGYPRPQSVVGFDQKKYDRREKILERKKEIGILRAIGASKRNISQVFNAETFIIGLCAGLIGIGLSLLFLIPGNMIIHHVADNTSVNAVLPPVPAVILIILSVVLTLIGGLIPSKKAAKSDPVTALRTE